MTSPLLTLTVHEALRAAARSGAELCECSLDLGRSLTQVCVGESGWRWNEQSYPWLERAKERTVYYWADGEFRPVARYTRSLIKLVPTEWGPPTFEIDGVKMLPSERVSPYADAQHKVSLIQPRGKVILDTCGGLGYFAACCLEGHAARVLSYEINPDVLWLRGFNPWSPPPLGFLTEPPAGARESPAGTSLTARSQPEHEPARLQVVCGNIVEHIATLRPASVDAILHDPPRFGIAGELYAQTFYDQLARVLKRGGRLFHYTGAPNKLTSGRDVPREVANRLRASGFEPRLSGDGVLAVRR